MVAVIVHFEIPDPIWARLLNVAEERGTEIPQLLSAAAVSITHGDPVRFRRATARRQRVIALVRAGLTDREVAFETGEVRQYVAEQRRKAGLAANGHQRNERTAA